jgi:uncharacterized protein (DUF2062 family)
MVGSARIRRWMEQLLHTHDTPRRTAAAYALGVFWGFSPILGLHTVLGLVCAFFFGLNRVAVILGVYSNLPWILPAYYTLCTILGAQVLGVDMQPRALSAAMRAITAAPWSWVEFQELWRQFGPVVWAYAFGSTVGSVLLAAIAYQVSLVMILAHRRRQALRPPERADL